MRFSYENLRADEVSGHTVADILVGVEADFTITDDTRTVLSEPDFPVAELAYHLSRWLGSEDEDRGFEFESMSADAGLVRAVKEEAGWVVGTILAPESWTRPVSYASLRAEAERFVQTVRSDMTSLGMDPHVIPAPAQSESTHD